MEVNTILWPTDLSKTSLKATKEVVSLAQKYGAKVVMLYVGVNLCDYFPAYGNYPSQDQLQAFQGWEMEHARARMEQVCAGELKGCPMIEVKLVQGEAALEIMKAVQDYKADMIVMTKRGKGSEEGKTNADFGSVADKVVRKAAVPVVVVNP